MFDTDVPFEPVQDPEMNAALDALRKSGRAGQARTLPADRLPAVLDPATKYSLVVVGDVFCSSVEGVGARRRRELKASLSDHLGVPVVEMDELHRRLAIGPRQVGTALIGATLVSLTYVMVLSHQN